MINNWQIFITIFIMLFASSCGKISIDAFSKKILIAGKVSFLEGKINYDQSGNLKSSQAVGDCTEDAYANLYAVNDKGIINRSNLLASQKILADATYQFALKSERIKKEKSIQVEISGCLDEYLEKRLITSFNSSQNITTDSTFITDIVNNSTYLLSASKINELKNLIVIFENFTGSEVEKNQLLLSVLGDSKEDVLQKIKPEIFIEYGGAITRENEAKVLKAYIHHPDSLFSAHYQWKVNDENYTTGKVFTYIPSKNASGQKNIKLELINDYSPGMDVEKTVTLQVLNSHPIEVPSFKIKDDLLVNNYILDNNLELEIDHVGSCETYSKFVITDNNILPSDESFIYSCLDSSVLLDALNTREGINYIYLWARDNEGNILKAQIDFYVDQTDPEAQIILSANKVKGGKDITISTAFTDNGSGVKSAKLSYSLDSFVSEVVLSANLMSTGSLNWTTPLSNQLLKFKLLLTDNVGNTKEVITNLEVDALAPSAPVLTLLSSNNTNIGTISAQLEGCNTSDKYLFIITTSSLVPNAPTDTSLGWMNCNEATSTKTLASIGDGNNAIYVWLKDDVGNISSISNKLTVYVDQTAPSFLQAPTIGTGVKPGSVHDISWTAYDLSQPIKMSYRLCDSSSCEAYIVSNVIESSITSLQKKITAPVTEKTGLYLEYTAADALGNTASGKSFFNVDLTPPVIQNIITNGGNKYAITPLVGLLIDIEDGENPLGMKVYMSSIELGSEAQFNSTVCPNSVTEPVVWLDWKNAQEPVVLSLDMKEGAKKICIYAKDGADNVSTPESALVVYEKKNQPLINNFLVYKQNPNNLSEKDNVNYNTGDTVYIEWNIYDVEGFGTKDVALSYSLDGISWLDIVTKQDINIASNVTWHSSSVVDQQSRKGSYASFKSPACVKVGIPNCQQFFRVKIFAKDRSETFSLPVMSVPQNTGRWSVFAGTEDRGIGGQGVSASLKMTGNLFQNLIKIDSKTGDLYLIDGGNGLRKYDVKTGMLSTLFDIDSSEDLKMEGTFTTSFRARVASLMNFLPINDHQLLLLLRDELTAVGYLYFVDYKTKTYRRILGGGNGRDLSLPFTFSIYPQILEKDENGFIYLMQVCDLDTFEPNAGNTEIIRVKMNADFSFTNREQVVGNCGGNTFNYSLGMNSEDFIYKHQYVNFTEFKIINSNYFYLGLFGKPYYKIINKKVYASALVAPSYPNLTYDKVNNIVYTKNANQGIKRYKINPLSGIDNEVDLDASEYVKSLVAGYQLGCNEEGVNKNSACILAMDMATGTNGQLYFVDGTKLNSNSDYIVKTINGDNVLKNVAGSLNFYGNGQKKNLIRGLIGGIHYNKETFGQIQKGLYLVSPNMVFGHIGEDDIYHTLFGNQIAQNQDIAAGTTVSPLMSMGVPYSGGEGFSMAFDEENIYFRLMGKIGHLDRDLKFNFLQNYNAAGVWETYGENVDIRTASLHPYATFQNLVVKENKFIFMGAYIIIGNSSYDSRIPQISLFDFDSNLKTYVMGYGHYFGERKTFSNFLSNESVRNTAVSSSCTANGCKIYYDKNTDRLYILSREDGVIRYITNPYLSAGVEPTKGVISNVEMKLIYTRSGAYLKDLNNIANLTVSEDSSQLFYLTETALYCVPLTPAGVSPWCNNENLYPYEKELGKFYGGPNSITWKDDKTLLISNFTNKILQFSLPE